MQTYDLDDILNKIVKELSKYNLLNEINPSVRIDQTGRIKLILNYHIQSQIEIDRNIFCCDDKISCDKLEYIILKQLNEMTNTIKKLPYETICDTKLSFEPVKDFDDFDVKCSALVPKGTILLNYDDHLKIRNFIVQEYNKVALLGTIKMFEE